MSQNTPLQTWVNILLGDLAGPELTLFADDWAHFKGTGLSSGLTSNIISTGDAIVAGNTGDVSTLIAQLQPYKNSQLSDQNSTHKSCGCSSKNGCQCGGKNCQGKKSENCAHSEEKNKQCKCGGKCGGNCKCRKKAA